jgi:hypothetical protein
MQRCNDCAHEVVDQDSICMACRRAAYLSRNRAIRDSIRAGVICAVSVLLLLAMIAAAKDALRYELETKPAILKAQGVR